MTNKNYFVLVALTLLAFGLVVAATAAVNGLQVNYGNAPNDRGHRNNLNGTNVCPANMTGKYQNLTSELGLPANATPKQIRDALFDKRFDEKISGLNLSLSSSIGDLKDALKLEMQNNASSGKGFGWRLGDLITASRNKIAGIRGSKNCGKMNATAATQ